MTMRLPNSVFVHVPRTGGMWFKDLVQRLGIKHQILTGDLDSHLPYSELPPSWRALPALGFVRHPLSWLKSRWSHLIEHKMLDDYRHFGVHRIFDAIAKPTFTETVQAVVEWNKGGVGGVGLVGLTFHRMLSGLNQTSQAGNPRAGVTHLVKTESLPFAAYRFLVDVEELLGLFDVTLNEKVNGTSCLSKYHDEFDLLPSELEAKFMASETLAMRIWKGAK